MAKIKAKKSAKSAVPKFSKKQVIEFFNDKDKLRNIVADLETQRINIEDTIDAYRDLESYLDDEITDVIDDNLFGISSGSHYDAVIKGVGIRVEKIKWETKPGNAPNYVAFMIPTDGSYSSREKTRARNFHKLPNVEQLRRINGDRQFTLFLYDLEQFKKARRRASYMYDEQVARWKKRNGITISEPKSFDEALKIAVAYAKNGKLPKGVGGPKPRAKAKSRAKQSEPMTQTERRSAIKNIQLK